MKNIYFLLIFMFLLNCSKSKTVLICGDHVCVNKAEAKQYFEDNLTLEVKIIDKKLLIILLICMELIKFLKLLLMVL